MRAIIILAAPSSGQSHDVWLARQVGSWGSRGLKKQDGSDADDNGDGKNEDHADDDQDSNDDDDDDDNGWAGWVMGQQRFKEAARRGLPTMNAAR